jgi:hypothetical protein
VIIRKDNSFPSCPSDGTEIYRGTAETCDDPTAIVGQIYYYAAFAADDRNNWSDTDAGAQWKSENVQEGSGLNITAETPENLRKFLHNGHLFIRHSSGTFTMLGQRKD